MLSDLPLGLIFVFQPLLIDVLGLLLNSKEKQFYLKLKKCIPICFRDKLAVGVYV